MALIQTNLVIDRIKNYYPESDCQVVPIITSGDLIKDKNLYDIGGKALFLKEIEDFLIKGEIDLAVHSLKDVPCKIPEALTMAAVLEKEDERDVFICKNYKSIEELPLHSRVGTSSMRRKILIQQKRPDLEIITFRGNIDTRIRKLLQGEVDVTILAYSGLKRLDLFDQEYCHLINIDQMLPCVGQGVIAIEICKNDESMQEVCSTINHLDTWRLIQTGRAFLEYLDADCRTPVAAYSEYLGEQIYTRFMLSNIAGSKTIFHSENSSFSNCQDIGVKAAKFMLENL